MATCGPVTDQGQARWALVYLCSLALFGLGWGTRLAVAEPTQATIPDAVIVAWGGDCVFGRAVALGSAKGGNPLSRVAPYLRAADLAVVNLEGPLTQAPRISRGPYDLRGDPAAAAYLAEAGVDLALVANNHTTDNGAAGLAETLAVLRSAGVEAVGGGELAAANSPALFTVRGVRLGVLAFDATGLGVPASPSAWGVARYDQQTARRELAALADRVDVRVVSLHWGVEDQVVPGQAQRSVAAELLSAGADLIVGHHPHVVQPIEWVARPGRTPALIAWSLGNLLFDALEPDRQRGMILETWLTKSGVRAFRPVPTYTDWRGAQVRSSVADELDLETRLLGRGAPLPSAYSRDGRRWWLSPARLMATTGVEVVSAGLSHPMGGLGLGEPPLSAARQRFLFSDRMR